MVSTMVSKTTSLSSSLSTPAKLKSLDLMLSRLFTLHFISLYFSIFLQSMLSKPLYICIFLNGVIFIFKNFIKIFLSLIVIVFFICIFFMPTLFGINTYSLNTKSEIISFSPDGFVWPTPGYTRINSYFGKRNAPTSGASTFHKGIDIGAPEGTAFIAVADGEITYANFLGGGGYTITLTVR